MTAVSNCVVHLTMRFDETVLSIGTGCLYKEGTDFFIVTAWHNLTGLHSETLKPLSKSLGIPNNLICTLAISVPDGGSFRISIILPLVDHEKSLFYIHKENHPRIDVAVIPFDPSADHRCEMHLSTGETRDMLISPIMKVHGNSSSEVCPIQNYLPPRSDAVADWMGSVEVTEELFIPGCMEACNNRLICAARMES
jgi:hypothetical protein